MGFESVSLMQWCLIFLWGYREISAEVLNHAITLAKVLKGFVIGFCALKTYVLPNALTKTDIRAIKHTLTQTAVAFDQHGKMFIKSEHFGCEKWPHLSVGLYFLNDLSLELQGHTHTHTHTHGRAAAILEVCRACVTVSSTLSFFHLISPGLTP